MAQATGSIVPHAIDAEGMAKVGSLMPEFLSGEASSYVAIMLGALWASPVGIDINKLFDALKEPK